MSTKKYVQPGDPEALQYLDGATIGLCEVCGRTLMVPTGSPLTCEVSCGPDALAPAQFR